MTTQDPFPKQAQVVIIGGGVIGCSVAYHLSKLGWQDVVVLERKQLTSGTTWHAAGLVVSGGFSTELTLNMAVYTRELYKRLETETGHSTGFKPVGYLEIATNKDRLEQYRRTAAFANAFNVNVHEISTAEFRQLWPIADSKDVIAAFYTPEDGRANPIDVTMSLAKGARMGGVQIIEDTAVTDIKVRYSCVSGVDTTRGEIQAEYVVNCAGMWGRELGKMAGVDVPLHAAEHYYLITEPMEGAHPDLPILEDPEYFAYYREEVGGLMIGLFEPQAIPWGMEGIPEDFTFGEIKPDWDRMMPYIEAAMNRVPTSKHTGIHKFFCGPESFTADLMPLMGEAPDLKNFYVAAGVNSLGILLGGGAGQIMAQWIVDGYPPVEVSEVNIDRMLPFQNTPRYLRDRTVEMLGMMYKTGYPNRQMETARNVRKTAFHDRLTTAGAYYSTYMGWEYPDWFAPKGVKPEVEYSWGRQNWFGYQAEEHQACREDVILMDLSMMSKLLVQGRDAERLLNIISANDVGGEVGKIVYTTWLNERGTTEADLTVTRLSDEQFLVISSDAIHNHVYYWMKRQFPEDAHVFVADITSAYAMLSVQGPKSRQLLSRLTQVDLSNEAFPYLTMQEIDMGYARPMALRVTYLGELGWELYIPTEFALGVYDALATAGDDLGLKNAGMQALNSLRLEKAYRDYGHDYDSQDTPLEAGLGYTVKFDKPGGFIGREALLQQKERRVLNQRLVQFLLEDPEPLMYYGEIIYKDHKRVGYIRTGGYGFTLGGSVGLGFVEGEDGVSNDSIQNGKFEIEIAGERYPAKASLRPMYDPGSSRVRM